MTWKQWGILLIIIALAAVLRLYNLGSNPPSLDWDEASLGWNAYSLYKTGTDEYGKAWPVSIRSFNDYKPPLYVYATVPSVAAFGLNEFAVRFPSAVAGVLMIVAVYLLMAKLTKLTPLIQLTSFLLAISPWSIQFSRVAFEANLALFFFVLGALFLVHFLQSVTTNYHRLLSVTFLPLSFFFFTASIYSYHSPRVVVPVFLLGIVIYRRNVFIKNWKVFILASALFLISLYPLARNTLTTASLTARFSDVSIFAAEKNPAKLAPLFAKNYLDHFNFDFLFLTGDSNPRHHAPDMGMLYLWEFPFLVAGLIFLFKNKPSWGPFVIWWLLIAPIASALTMTTPHAVRSLLFLPTFQILTAFGILKIYKSLKILKLLTIFLFVINIFYFLHQYFVHLPIEEAPSWQYGYKQMVKKVVAMENKYDRVFVTSAYDQPYIYFLFYGRISPIIKNNTYFSWGLDKYEFDLKKRDPKGLYVLAPSETLPGFLALDEVNFPDGKIAFLLGTLP